MDIHWSFLDHAYNSWWSRTMSPMKVMNSLCGWVISWIHTLNSSYNLTIRLSSNVKCLLVPTTISSNESLINLICKARVSKEMEWWDSLEDVGCGWAIDGWLSTRGPMWASLSKSIAFYYPPSFTSKCWISSSSSEDTSSPIGCLLFLPHVSSLFNSNYIWWRHAIL